MHNNPVFYISHLRQTGAQIVLIQNYLMSTLLEGSRSFTGGRFPRDIPFHIADHLSLTVSCETVITVYAENVNAAAFLSAKKRNADTFSGIYPLRKTDMTQMREYRGAPFCADVPVFLRHAPELTHAPFSV